MPSITGTSSSAKSAGSQNQLTFSHTSTGDPLFVSTVNWGNGQYVSTLTYGGVPLRKIGGVAAGSFWFEWWSLEAPSAGTANVVVTLTGTSIWFSAGARNVSGAAGAAANGRIVGATGSNTTPTLTIASATSELILDMVASDAASQVFTQGAGQAADFLQNSIAGTDVRASGSSEAGAASVTMSWTLSVSDAWGMAALAIPTTAPTAPAGPTTLAEVQNTGKVVVSAGTAITLTFASPPTVGNGIVVEVLGHRPSTHWDFAAGNCVDNQGKTYAMLAADHASSVYAAVACYYLPYVAVTGSPYSITITPTAATNNLYLVACAWEVSGVGTGLQPDRSGVLNQVGAQNVFSAGVHTSAPLRVNSVFEVAALNCEGISSVAVESGWTQNAESLSLPYGEINSRIRNSGAFGFYATASWTMNTSRAFVANVVSFRATISTAPGTYSRVQAVTNRTILGNVITLALGAPPQIGNGIIVAFGGTLASVANTRLTDNFGNMYDPVITRTGSASGFAGIYVCTAVQATGFPFVITLQTTDSFVSWDACAIEVSGATGGSLRADRAISNTGSTAAASTGSTAALRTTGTSAFAVAVIHGGSSNVNPFIVEVVTPPWLEEYDYAGGGNPASGEADSRVLTGALNGTVQSASWTLTTAGGWNAVLAIFASSDTLPPLEMRVSTVHAEYLSDPPARVRATQQVVEVLTEPLAPGRVSQVVVEVLSTVVAVASEKSDLWID